MTRSAREKLSCGASKSSICFHTCTALIFLFFTVLVLSGIEKLNLNSGQVTGEREEEGPVFLRDLCALLSVVSVLSFPEGRVPGRCPRPAKSCPEKKKPRAESGRTFLHSPVYQAGNCLVK